MNRLLPLLLAGALVGCAEDPTVTEAYDEVAIDGTLPEDADADSLVAEFLASGAQFGLIGDPGSEEVAMLQRLDRTVSNYGFTATGPATCLDCGGINSTCTGPAGFQRMVRVPMQRNAGNGSVDVSYTGPTNWSAVGQNCDGGACPQPIGEAQAFDVDLVGNLNTCSAFSVFFNVDVENTTSISSFSGGDSGEGLDLDGTFPYAITMASNGGQTVRDANFTLDSSTPGVTLGFVNTITNWFLPNFGATSNDNGLEAVMRGIRWTAVNQTPAGYPTGTVTVELDSLTVGRRYKAQLLFAEECCNRAFHVVHDRQVIAEDFNPGVVHGGISNDSAGAVVTHEFTATATTTTFQLDAILTAAQLDHPVPPNASSPDRNPILNGLTLEAL